jgi:uncharacterized membrane protein YphA (DoxX/SURF4 family)
VWSDFHTLFLSLYTQANALEISFYNHLTIQHIKEGAMQSANRQHSHTHVRRYSLFAIFLLVLLTLLPTSIASAHVKWFSDFSFLDQPVTLTQALTTTFFYLAALSLVVVVGFVLVDRQLGNLRIYQQITSWLEARRDYSTVVLRVGIGITLLLSWQADSLLAPYLPVDRILGWVQFVLALLLILPITTPIAGAGIIVLWVIGIFDFGPFYMLDYLAFVGIGIWLLVSQFKNPRVRGLGIPALYSTVGFSLAWLAIEKIIYPSWGVDVLETTPQLSLGLPFIFFLTAAAFVEFTLGYLLIIGLLSRPLGLIITLVFFTTTLFFGKVEVIGHTHLHAALIVFLLNGPGRFYPAPIDIHRRLNWRAAFAAVNFLLILAVFLLAYSFGAQRTYAHAVEEVSSPEVVEECRLLVATGDEVELESIVVVVDDREVPCTTILDYENQTP